jgi:hypothetical protein
MVVLGYDSHNCIKNLGSIAIFTAAFVVLAIIAVYLTFLVKFFPKLRNMLAAILQKIMYKLLLDMVLETVLELMISSKMNLEKPLFTTDGEIIANYFNYVILLILAVFLPISWFYYFLQPIEILET